MLEIYSTGEGGTAGSGKPPVIDKTMAKRIATQLNWAPIDNAEWNYNPVTGEPLVEGWPLYSGLPQYGTEDPQYQHDPRQKIRTPERNAQILDTEQVESSHLRGQKMLLLVKEFFEEYLDVVEESDSGRMFNPIQVSCCRAMKIEPLGKLLTEMRALSGARPERENT